ncbi:hypothetical protein BDW72DRAFT_177914 [Aspergillus terricola var. indicus]
MSQAVQTTTETEYTATETTSSKDPTTTFDTDDPTTTTTEITTGTTTTTITITGSHTSYTPADGDPTSPATVTIYSPLPTSRKSGSSLTTGAKAGIGVGVVLGVLLAILGAIIFLRRYRKSAKGGNTGRSELDNGPISESTKKTNSPAEMEATERRVFELPSKSGLEESGLDRSRERYELAT